ncbi:MAG: ATP-binding cassette domain-containing protein, partial [Armatimonadota bacterium]|nr:ATP-binding cassette domain-containing protein [Armatimonadota bacterium]
MEALPARDRRAPGALAGDGGPAIVVDQVHMAFEQHGRPLHVLSDVSLTVRQGEFIALLGPSGCGKSTLLRLVADILQPTRGAITVLG